MFARDADPIDHRPPLKRVDLNARQPEPNVGPSTWEICDALMRTHEGNRIWQITVDIASGTNAPLSVPELPSEPIDS